MTTLYRFLTGPDDSTFCHKISEALSKGWDLHGPTTMTFDTNTQKVVAGQAVTKTIDKPYDSEMKLGQQ